MLFIEHERIPFSDLAEIYHTLIVENANRNRFGKWIGFHRHIAVGIFFTGTDAENG